MTNDAQPPGGNQQSYGSSSPPPLPSRRPRSGVPGWAIALIICGGLFAFLFVIGILAGLLLPALAKAKQKAQLAVCENNLRQIGLAFRVWEGSHGNQYPFNVSTNAGGTREFSAMGPDGFDKNSWMHFQAISNELLNPRLLICPADGSRMVAMDFDHIQPVNVSYIIHSGLTVNDNNPQVALAYCPVHHNVLLADGSVMHLTDLQNQQFLTALAAKSRAGPAFGN